MDTRVIVVLNVRIQFEFHHWLMLNYSFKLLSQFEFFTEISPFGYIHLNFFLTFILENWFKKLYYEIV